MGEAASMLTESFTQARTVRAYRLEAVESGARHPRLRAS